MAQAAGKQVHADEPAALQVGTNQKGRRRDGRRIQRVKRGRKTQACMVSGGCNASTCSRASKVRCDQMVVEVQCVLLSAQGGRLKPAHAMARDEAACRSAAAKRLAGRQAGRQAGRPGVRRLTIDVRDSGWPPDGGIVQGMTCRKASSSGEGHPPQQHSVVVAHIAAAPPVSKHGSIESACLPAGRFHGYSTLPLLP